MSRGRVCFMCSLRLAVYVVAMFSVWHAANPPGVARLVTSLEASAYHFTEPLFAVLLLGVLLEVLSGAVRCR